MLRWVARGKNIVVMEKKLPTTEHSNNILQLSFLAVGRIHHLIVYQPRLGITIAFTFESRDDAGGINQEGAHKGESK